MNNTSIINALLSILLLILIAGCNSSDNESVVEADFKKNLTLWKQQGVVDYQITTSILCNCLPRGKVVNLIEQSQLTRAFYSNTGVYLIGDDLSLQKPIDGYFAIIREAIDSDAASINVTYHDTLGFPTRISIDYDLMTADDEIIYSLENFITGIDELDKPDLVIALTLRDNFNQLSENYIQNETINFNVAVTNNGSADATIDFNSSLQFDFYVASSSLQVWRWSDDKDFTQALTTLNIAAGEMVEFSQPWDQLLSNSEILTSGDYRAFGVMVNTTLEDSFDFTVQ